MAPNPNAVALGKLGKNRPKTMTPAAIRQRQEMTKARVRKQKADELWERTMIMQKAKKEAK